MQLPTITPKNQTDTIDLINTLNSQDANHTYIQIDKPIGTTNDGGEYHCVVLSAGKNEYLSGTPWSRVVENIITWANRHGTETMGVYYVDMDSQDNPLVRISSIHYPEVEE